MTDENSTWVVQNQQTSSSQNWDDFVLDFWEWENEKNTSSVWETVDSSQKEVNDESLDNQQDEDIDFNQNDLFWNDETWDIQKEEENHQDLNNKVDDKTVVNNGFDISLDNESRDEESYLENSENLELSNDDYNEKTEDVLPNENDLNLNNTEGYDDKNYSEENTEKLNTENDSLEQQLDTQDEKDDFNIYFDEKSDESETSKMDRENDEINFIDEWNDFKNTGTNESDKESQNDEDSEFVMDYDNENKEDDKIESNEGDWDMNQTNSEGESNIYDEKDTEDEETESINFQEDNLESANETEPISNELQNDEDSEFVMDYDNENKEDDKIESNEGDWDMNQINSEGESDIYDEKNPEDEETESINFQEDNLESANETEFIPNESQNDLENDSNLSDENSEVNKSKWKKDDNLDFVMDFDQEEQDNNEIKQPEIQDLMWKESIYDFQDDVVEKTENIIQNNSNVSDDLENINGSEYKNLNQWENSEVDNKSVYNISTENNTENFNNDQPNFVENHENSQTGWSENFKDISDETDNSSIQEMPAYDLNDKEEIKPDYFKNDSNLNYISINNQNLWEVQQNGAWSINANESVNENVITNANIQGNPEIQNNINNNVEISGMRSTLSLDQILDSELINNPKFADNTKAVPRNIPTNSWFFSNKRLVWIVAWVWIFLLAWFVVVLAFPFNSSERKAWDVVNATWSQIEEFHDVAPDTTDEQLDDTGTKDKEWSKTAGSTVQEFPDPDQWWDDTWDIDLQDQWTSWWEVKDKSWDSDPKPFVWDIDEEIDVETEDFSLADVAPTIESFKNQAEFYYSLWEENQDKKLIKYAAQTINLCETYQTQTENWEWLDVESFNSFKEKAKTLIKKMETHLWWWEEIETVRKSNYNEEYYFTWKDDLIKFINDRENS